jgi:predicted N-formylglutamate amidohydrolase
MPNFFFSCEHASNKIPPAYASLFVGHAALLKSHRGWDPGALELAQFLARAFRAPIVTGRYSRLLVDLNRTEGHSAAFSTLSRAAGKEKILRQIHRPYGRKVRQILSRKKNTIHIGVHSFTPVMKGHVRSTDIGLLYDPALAAENKFCRAMQSSLRNSLSLAVHRNLPYRGTGNGLINSLRGEKLPGYVGV